MVQVFLCHASADSVPVEALYQRLQSRGFQPWMASLDLLPNQQWQQEIPRVLKDAEVVIVFFSRQSVATQCAVPCAFHLARETLEALPAGAIPTLAIRLDHCDVPEPFVPLPWTEVSTQEGFERIVHALQDALGPRQQLASAPSSASAWPRTLRNSLGMVCMLMPAGTFVMGASDDVADLDEQPVHQVTLTQPFYLGKYAVTQGQWEAVMGENPSAFQGDPYRPVEQVSWEDVQAFLARLHGREGGAPYRLPTEAEWEYACRAGSTTAYSCGDDPRVLGEYAWYWDTSDVELHAIGQLKSNAWGLHDMHGNVQEWVQDWYGAYPAKSVTDPLGPAMGSLRILRGGSWYDEAEFCRSAARYSASPSDRYPDVGFRLAREVV